MINLEINYKHTNILDMEEKRDYSLNLSRAMKKKLAATEENLLTVTETGGGIKFTYNAGMYELFKMAADSYFMSDSMKEKCDKT